MLCSVVAYTGAKDWPQIYNHLAPRTVPEKNLDDEVKKILAAVKKSGDKAVVEYGRRFDCKSLKKEMLFVNKEETAKAKSHISAVDRDILLEAAQNIRDFHSRQKENSWWMTRADGSLLGQMVRPVDRAGLYIPGGQSGKTPLISSLLMNAIPAQVAGVEEIVLATPPCADGSINPWLLATAELLGIDKILRAGSAWAVAAMAYGTESVPRVDIIAGPGNIFVTTAKRLLMGEVGIDMIAGPSEIAIIADEHAHPEYVAADILSQAEHDTLASAILMTTSKKLAKEVEEALAVQLKDLPRADIARTSLQDWGMIIHCKDLETAFDCANRLAPEHLELAIKDPWSMLEKVRHAGAVFMGNHCPEAVGDYFAGPNHVLPTLSTARFSSALCVGTFMKTTSVLATSPTFMQENAIKIARLARLEELEAHARSAEKRIAIKTD